MVTVKDLEQELDNLAVSGEILFTAAKGKPFTVGSPGKGRYFYRGCVPSRNSAICPSYFERIVEIWNRTGGSMRASDYSPPTKYGGCYCAVLERIGKR